MYCKQENVLQHIVYTRAHLLNCAWHLFQVLISIQSLLTDPYCHVCMEPKIGTLNQRDKPEFERIARLWTWKYAMHDYVMPTDVDLNGVWLRHFQSFWLVQSLKRLYLWKKGERMVCVSMCVCNHAQYWWVGESFCECVCVLCVCACMCVYMHVCICAWHF